MSDASDFRTQPHSLEAERCLLGSMMIDKDACVRCLPLVRPEDFYSDDHREMYNAICRVVDSGRNVDSITVREEMKERNVYEACGGATYLAAVLNAVPSASHAANYAEVVSSRSMSRRMIRAVGDALHELYQLKDPSTVERLLLAAVAGLRGNSSRDTSPKPLEEILHTTYERLSSGVDPRLPSCLPEVQEILGGYGYGEFSVVAAWPSVGKSVFVKQEAIHWALAGVPTGLLSLEETEGMIAEKYFSSYSGVPNKRVRRGDIRDGEWPMMGEALTKLAPAKLFVRDGLHTLDDVLAAAHRLVAEHGVKAIVVDHLHRITLSGRATNLNQHFTEVSGALKALFLRTGVAGLCAAQLTKEGMRERREPHHGDLRESGAIFQDCDTLVLLHREDRHHIGVDGYHRDNEAKAILSKNRGGTCGAALLGWDGDGQRFVRHADRPAPAGVF
jgi:replicative DNA helicase